MTREPFGRDKGNWPTYKVHTILAKHQQKPVTGSHVNPVYLAPKRVCLNQHFPVPAHTRTATQITHTYVTENLRTETKLILLVAIQQTTTQRSNSPITKQLLKI